MYYVIQIKVRCVDRRKERNSAEAAWMVILLGKERGVQ